MNPSLGFRFFPAPIFPKTFSFSAPVRLRLRVSVRPQGQFCRMATVTNPRDPNTLSNYNNWRSAHITANFEILFEQKKLVGNVVHQLRSTTEAQSKEIILDTSHLDIGEVKVDGQPSKWELLPALEPFGTPLKISLEKGVQLDGTIEVDVCSSLSWHPLGREPEPEPKYEA